MSAISLKSISGITSITTPAGVDDQLTLHNNNTTERVKIDVAGNVHVNNHLAVAGVTTFAGNIELTGTIGEDAARIKIPDGMNGGPFTGNLEFGNNRDFVMVGDGHHNYVKANNGNIYVTCGGNTLTTLQTNGTVLLNKDLDVDGHTNLDNVSISGVTTASQGLRVPNGSATTNYISNDSNVLRFWGTTHSYADIRNGSLHFRNNALKMFLKYNKIKMFSSMGIHIFRMQDLIRLLLDKLIPLLIMEIQIQR